MKLIKIETKGFKSFANKITLNFDGGVVGIVGPNGSGKSNINDAIKWVLGERSIKSLRGSNSDDIIFSGSKTSEKADFAEVSLTFDNSEGKLSIPHKIFKITRLIRRGTGENEYFINDEIAKLRDIEEIAMESGISKSSLAIISQGTIQNIAQATPEERRFIFEEAAGISKYKTRKEEALRKLEKTEETLNKLKTIIYELEKQISPLEKQANKAKIFLEKKEELKDIEIGLIVEDFEFFGLQLKELNFHLEDVLKNKDNLNEKVSEIEIELEEKTSFKLKLENEILELSNKLQEVSDKLRDLDIFNSQASQRRKMIIDGQINASDSLRIEVLKEELEELSTKINHYKITNEKILIDILNKKNILELEQQKLSIVSNDLEKSKRDLLQAKTRINILKEQEKNKSHLFKGTKIILDNKNLFPGVFGIVSDLIKVDEKFISAIEVALANSLQHIIVQDSDVAIKAINFLKNNNGGRSTFIPLKSIRPKGIIEEHFQIIKEQKGFISVASEIIKTDANFEILKRFLLGNIIVVETIENGEIISKLMKSQYMIVSLDGDIIRPGGVISGGEKGKNKDVIGIGEQIEKIENTIPKLEKEISTKQIEYSQLSNVISENEVIITELNIEIAKIKEKNSFVEFQFNKLKEEYENDSNSKFTSFKNENIADQSIELFESEKLSIQTSLNAKRNSLININHDLARLNIEKNEIEKVLRDLVEESSEKMTQKNQAEYIIETSTKRLTEEYEMTLENAAINFSLKINRDDAREIVSNLRSEIKELGNVNVDAIVQFEEVSSRFNSLKTAEEEVVMAKNTILNAIKEMDNIIISKLDETVKKVNKEIVVIFQKLFGGGSVEVKYTDSFNLLQTGIDVIAQPPGKTVKNLNLFSGGEKALIAISLLFAILKSKPLPLCILDEVEAALDDANVIRFAEYLQELKHQTQFMVITHRIGTMSRVDQLFGATMQTKGITQFFTVKLADAKKLIE